MMNSLTDVALIPEIEIRETPWMSPTAVSLFAELLAASARFLEYGAGGSTRFAAQHGLQSITSVESDPRFLQAVDAYIRRDAPDIDWHPIPINLGRTGPLGYPRSLRPTSGWIRYPLAPWHRNLNPDLILVDGRFRLACALAAAQYAAPGTLVLIDDYGLRPWYWSVRKILPEVARAGRARVFEVTGNRPAWLRDALRRACRDPR